ncbi:putative tail fiber assembly protein [Canicola haemoglobinophilus]|uniref:Tail fiber assembly protein n=1 Tax=Canicola haemoglobinophilus TaxID=733 RepID=A0AB38HCP8_9PAST|nr:DUF4376 domain-containing protein [Canicola haemoglobinophilus]STO55375.1 putative tail fiber assembly protein [Canicola haemoglobinophilus]STO69056.1 putative tail fiber assembly protein [Canicola haemoglobinophilus]
MTIYFKDGFYISDIHEQIPENAVEISEDLYRTLLEGQAEGKQIVMDEKGYPQLAEPQPSPLHHFENGQWVISKEHQTQLKADQQAQVWELIKQKRHDNLRGGCFVESVGKWFHTNDESRQQYIFMRTLDQLPPNIQWKTMDNSFVLLTKALLDELSMQMLLDEQADFANAERHKALMEQADNPLDYDFSTGWTEIYQQGN